MVVTVEATQDHTYQGAAYAVGTRYETDEATAESLAAQGKAKRVTDAAPAPTAAPVAADEAPSVAPTTRTPRGKYQTTKATVPHKTVLTPKSKSKRK